MGEYYLFTRVVNAPYDFEVIKKIAHAQQQKKKLAELQRIQYKLSRNKRGYRR